MNQNPEQLARDIIDAELKRNDWCVLVPIQINFIAYLLDDVRYYRKNITFRNFKYPVKSIQKINLNPLK